ncbi:MAG TPA: Holliday junction resolvase RuvX, partial [bacterium]|nr:Holliday junction resolvase RuvX [bacterium]
QQAETIMLQADLSRRKRKKYIDKLSAQIILQNYLDSLKEDIGEEM